MKSVAILSMLSAASAHYLFPNTIVGNQASANWEYIRHTANDPASNGVEDLSSAQLACLQTGVQPAPEVLSIAAGTNIGFKSTNTMGHPGPQLWYMAKIPSGQTLQTFDPSGKNVWFKIAQRGAIDKGGYLDFEAGMSAVNTTLPKSLANGDYLLKFEHIALHLETPQVYTSCAQVRITGGGSAAPSGLVAFPGAYQAGSAPFKRVYEQKPPYTYPGPALAKL